MQEWGWRQSPEGRPRVRASDHPALPNGQELSVVTDLWDEVKYPAEAMLATYHGRWGLETVFHQITDVFSLKHLIGSQPQAVLFQLWFCLLLYNALQVVAEATWRSLAMRGADTERDENLLLHARLQLVAVSELIPVDELLVLLGEVPKATALRESLWGGIARSVERTLVENPPSSGGGGHKKVKTRVLGNHTSTYRVLQQTNPRRKDRR